MSVPQTTITIDGRERVWKASAKNMAEFFRALGGRKNAIERLNSLTIEGPDGKRVSNQDLDEVEALDVLTATIWAGIMLDADCPTLHEIGTILTFPQVSEAAGVVIPLLSEALSGERPTPAPEPEAVLSAA